jgi:exosortase H (IPTLxxWG-CTERM-specific)
MSRIPLRRLPPVARFSLLFLGLAAAAIAMPVIDPIQQHLVLPFTLSLATLSAAVIRWCGGGASSAADVLSLTSGCGAVRIANGCNAIEISGLLAAAILAYPASLRSRLAGVLAGIGLLQAVNLARIISLLYLSCFSQRWFAFFHEYAWDTAIAFDALLIFLGWQRWQARPKVAVG